MSVLSDGITANTLVIFGNECHPKNLIIFTEPNLPNCPEDQYKSENISDISTKLTLDAKNTIGVKFIVMGSKLIEYCSMYFLPLCFFCAVACDSMLVV